MKQWQKNTPALNRDKKAVKKGLVSEKVIWLEGRDKIS